MLFGESRSTRGYAANSWTLVGAKIACGPVEVRRRDLEARSGKITAIRPSTSSRLQLLDLRGCLILPGLINAHDHLEFNLFPRLGRGPYPNAGAWARDIYHPDVSPVREQLGISLEGRLRWGAVKNLLSGVTTVCHHNPYNPAVFSGDFAVRVPRRFGWAHSLEFSPDLTRRFKRTPRAWPFILHLGEAVDRGGRQELLRLDSLGALDHRTVLVHAVALGKPELNLAHKRGASVVWCPSSNIFILGRTLNREALESGVPIALGTDSAMSGKGDILEEMRLARRIARISQSRLYEMVTRDAARIMRLRQGEGSVIEGGSADLLVVRDRGEDPASTLLKLRTGEMEMVLVRGEIKLASPRCLEQLPATVRRRLHPVEVAGNRGRIVFVAADVPSLFGEVESVLGSVMLAHKRLEQPS
ncbi:MAG TPA: amidohydrolase family protein [Acidobacteriota bacterium]|nr:amidohydrolase family protein [Acidobacteriota bacterium]